VRFQLVARVAGGTASTALPFHKLMKAECLLALPELAWTDGAVEGRGLVIQRQCGCNTCLAFCDGVCERMQYAFGVAVAEDFQGRRFCWVVAGRA
jgi:hypothetical protein